jgi:hypothetical protein
MFQVAEQDGGCRAKKALRLKLVVRPIHEGEALAKAIIETVARLERRDSENP